MAQRGGLNFNFTQMTAELFEGYRQYMEASSKSQQAYIAPCGFVFERLYQDCLDDGVHPQGGDCLFNKLYNIDGKFCSVLSFVRHDMS